MARRKKQSTAQPVLLTIPDVAITLGVCRTTVYNLIYDNGLPYVVVRGVKRVYLDSLHTWLRKQERQTA